MEKCFEVNDSSEESMERKSEVNAFETDMYIIAC